MANKIYGYNSGYGGAFSSIFPSRLTQGSVSDPYLSESSLIGSSRYLSSDHISAADSSKFSIVDRGPSMFFNQSDALRFSGSDIGGIGGASGFSAGRISGVMGAGTATSSTPSLLSQMSWPGVEVGATVDPVIAGVKRPTEALYHQTVLGNHNTIGHSEAFFSANSKRPRFESASNLPVYPQRPGEKDCAHYMLTRTCKFGDNCKFDHPIWVPEGGIPDWKEVPAVAVESLPERPGEPDCPYFLKTQRCKFGIRCKFNHPKEKVDSLASENVDVSVLPERPSEPPCSFYLKTGKCKFGANCKFHHPKDIEVTSAGQENGNGEQAGNTETIVQEAETTTGDLKLLKPSVTYTPALLHNSKGLPVRPGEVDCPFYLKTGSCKYGTTCRYNHPDRSAINPPMAGALGHSIMSSPAANLNIGVINPSASMLPTIDPRLGQTALGLGPTIYPQRPGQIECDFYMKTGQCKFGERCKFHHPIDRSAPTPSMTKQALQQNVKLTLAGLPRREGAISCPFYMKTGTCKYGVTCRFDHPPPGEAVAMATAVGEEGEQKDGELGQAEQD